MTLKNIKTSRSQMFRPFSDLFAVFPGGGKTGCNYNGQHVAIGDKIPDPTGCGSCTCHDDGLVYCTQMLDCVSNSSSYPFTAKWKRFEIIEWTRMMKCVRQSIIHWLTLSGNSHFVIVTVSLSI